MPISTESQSNVTPWPTIHGTPLKWYHRLYLWFWHKRGRVTKFERQRQQARWN